MKERIDLRRLRERTRLSPRLGLGWMDGMRPPCTISLNAPSRFAVHDMHRRATSSWTCSIAEPRWSVAIVEKQNTDSFDN